jgi:hypothetical protein
MGPVCLNFVTVSVDA